MEPTENGLYYPVEVKFDTEASADIILDNAVQTVQQRRAVTYHLPSVPKRSNHPCEKMESRVTESKITCHSFEYYVKSSGLIGLFLSLCFRPYMRTFCTLLESGARLGK